MPRPKDENAALAAKVRMRIGTNLVIGDDAGARAALDALLARLAEAEKERDEALAINDLVRSETDLVLQGRDGAEAERDRLRDALEAIYDFEPHSEVVYDEFAYRRVVAALQEAAGAALRAVGERDAEPAAAEGEHG